VEKLCNFISIDPEYINLYSIRVKYGRNFSRELSTEGQGSYLVNEAACKAFGIDNPVGRMIHEKVIVGVVKDFNFSTLHNLIEPLFMSCEGGSVIQIKIAGENQQATVDYIDKACKDVLPDEEYDLSFLDNRIKVLYKPELDLKRSFRVYSFITFFIALLGLLGLTQFQARKMTKEISIRKIHGAGRMDTFWRFTKEYLRIIMISNALAVPVSQWVMNKWLAHFQYRAEADPFIFLKTLIITAFFILLSVSFFIIRTHNTDPLKTVKYE
jgi:putative ABC transport system permease protein